jgi:hypothetical protein
LPLRANQNATNAKEGQLYNFLSAYGLIFITCMYVWAWGGGRRGACLARSSRPSPRLAPSRAGLTYVWSPRGEPLDRDRPFGQTDARPAGPPDERFL